MLGKRTSNLAPRISTPPNSRVRTRIMLGVGTALAAIGGLLGTASPAAAGGPLLRADGNDIGKRWTVCAQDLTVRSTPGGPVIGTLTGPRADGPAQTFTITDAHGGEWISGHAWGRVNQDGYVQNGWFCADNQAGTTASPAAPAVPVPATSPPPSTGRPAATAPPAAAAAAAAECSSPFYASATPTKDIVAPIPIADNGWRSYSVGISSYLKRCGGYVYARHCVYIDTRNLPRGHKVWLTVSTQRSDGKWARAHKTPILQIAGKQEIQEVCLRQRRGVVVQGQQLTITRVRVWHTATTPSSGALIPKSSTLEGIYKSYYGPEAKPGH